MSWQVLVTEGADKGRTFTLVDDGVTTFGSSRRNADVSLNDLYVHRVHCELEVSGDRVVAHALDPDHPIVVNGKKVHEYELHHGDVFRIGNTHLQLQPTGTDAPAEEVEGEEGYNVEVIDDEPAEAAGGAAARQPGGLSAPTAPAVRPAARPAAAAPLAAHPPPPPVRPAPATAAPPALPPALPLERMGELAGHVLAHYEVDRLLGIGSCGAVFHARNQKTGVEVALRVLAPPFPAHDGEMQTFIQALKVALPVRHRHLVSMWNAGRTGPYCWLAVDYVDGQTLARVFAEVNTPGKMAWKHALRLAVHVGRALNYLCCHKLHHGHVTPPNIFIRNADRLVKLGDLMLTKILEGSCLEKAAHLRRLQNELPYWSPEQAAPEPHTDIRSDVYSLGACVFTRCTGQPPFRGASPEETVQLIHKAPLPLMKPFQEAIPDAFEEVVLRMLDRRPEDRYDTPAALLADLESIAEAEAVEI
jgi:serine/threonine-protein kinase